MPVNSAQFGQVFLANAAGTLTEVTQYVQSITPTRGSESTDVSTMATGGGRVAQTILRGAATSEYTIKFVYDPALCKLLRQLFAARSGFALQKKSGSNAAPAQGDELQTGTYTNLNTALTFDTGKPATIDFDVKPADGGVAPAFGLI